MTAQFIIRHTSPVHDEGLLSQWPQSLLSFKRLNTAGMHTKNTREWNKYPAEEKRLLHVRRPALSFTKEKSFSYQQNKLHKWLVCSNAQSFAVGAWHLQERQTARKRVLPYGVSRLGASFPIFFRMLYAGHTAVEARALSKRSVHKLLEIAVSMGRATATNLHSHK